MKGPGMDLVRASVCSIDPFMKKFRHILVVDDDPAARYLAGIALGDASIGEKISYFQNGADALLLIGQSGKATCPDLIILDMVMPVMDGYEFLEELHKTSRFLFEPLPIILLSSSSFRFKQLLLPGIEILAYMEKPLEAEKLCSLIEGHFAKPLSR